MEGSKRHTFLKGLDNIRELDVFSPAMLRIRDVANNPKTSASDLANEILHDQSLTARILKIANSVYYTPYSGKIGTLTQAVVIMGFDEIKQLALSVSLYDQLSTSLVKNFNFERFWAHSLAVAIGAYRLSGLFNSRASEEAFVGGFLHDLGKLIIARYTPDEWKAIVKKVNSGYTTTQAEITVIGTHHSEVGEYVARKWNFPEPLLIAIRKHHREGVKRGVPSREPMADLIYYANLCANFLFPSPLGTPMTLEQLKDEGAALYDLGGKIIERVLQSVRKDVIETAEELSIEIRDSDADLPDHGEDRELREQFQKLKKDLTRKVHEFNTLKNLAIEMLKADNYKSIYSILVDEIVMGHLFERAIIFRIHPGKQVLQGVASRGLREHNWLPRFRLTDDKRDLVSEVIRSGEYWFVEKIAGPAFQGATAREMIEKLDLKQFGCVPVKINGRVELILVVDNAKSMEPITREMVDTVSHFASQAGLILERIDESYSSSGYRDTQVKEGDDGFEWERPDPDQWV